MSVCSIIDCRDYVSRRQRIGRAADHYRPAVGAVSAVAVKLCGYSLARRDSPPRNECPATMPPLCACVRAAAPGMRASEALLLLPCHPGPTSAPCKSPPQRTTSCLPVRLCLRQLDGSDTSTWPRLASDRARGARRHASLSRRTANTPAPAPIHASEGQPAWRA